MSSSQLIAGCKYYANRNPWFYLSEYDFYFVSYPQFNQRDLLLWCHSTQICISNLPILLLHYLCYYWTSLQWMSNYWLCYFKIGFAKQQVGTWVYLMNLRYLASTRKSHLNYCQFSSFYWPTLELYFAI